MIAFLLAAAVPEAVSDHWVAQNVRRAPVVASCRVGPDCDAKWRRARQWIGENSRFGLARDTGEILITFGAIYADVHPSMVVAMDPARDGLRPIRFRAWCGNLITCRPSPRSLRTLFQQAMQDAE